jgi:hypothetical protein
MKEITNINSNFIVYNSTCKTSTVLGAAICQKNKNDLDANGGDPIEYILQLMQ